MYQTVHPSSLPTLPQMNRASTHNNGRQYEQLLMTRRTLRTGLQEDQAVEQAAKCKVNEMNTEKAKQLKEKQMAQLQHPQSEQLRQQAKSPIGEFGKPVKVESSMEPKA